jgi:hypothetical protein
MTDARRMLIAMVVLFGLCAALVTITSKIASHRPAAESAGAPPQSSLQADYAIDEHVWTIAPLEPDIRYAASRDRELLGLRDLGFSPAPPIAAAYEAASLAPAAGDGDQAPVLAAPDGAAAPAPDSNTTPLSQPASFPTLPAVLALLVVTGVVAGAYYAFRPPAD